jgi:hypothetical protein
MFADIEEQIAELLKIDPVRVTIELAPEDPDTIVVNWADSRWDTQLRSAVKDAVRAALPRAYQDHKIIVT